VEAGRECGQGPGRGGAADFGQTGAEEPRGASKEGVGGALGLTAQGRAGGGEQHFPGIGPWIANPDAPRAQVHLGGDFQQAQANRAHMGSRPLGAPQSQLSQGAQQHIGEATIPDLSREIHAVHEVLEARVRAQTIHPEVGPQEVRKIG